MSGNLVFSIQWGVSHFPKSIPERSTSPIYFSGFKPENSKRLPSIVLTLTASPIPFNVLTLDNSDSTVFTVEFCDSQCNLRQKENKSSNR